ncbi:MAG: hypothetical protein J6S60_10220 [Oscillospiraceae bacterium]|nr:hypothetical protein [Oscillospiraceae bacterium]
MNTKKALLTELANTMEKAAALAREIAEREPERITLTLDGETLNRVVYTANHGNRAACKLLPSDQGKTSPTQSASCHPDSLDQS